MEGEEFEVNFVGTSNQTSTAAINASYNTTPSLSRGWYHVRRAQPSANRHLIRNTDTVELPKPPSRSWKATGLMSDGGMAASTRPQRRL